MLALKVDDYKPDERRVLIRESKGREPRALPVSPCLGGCAYDPGYGFVVG